MITGTYGRGGTGDNGKTNAITDGKITVPVALWKVIVVLPVGSDDLSRISTQTRIIAIWAPNTNAAGQQPWVSFRVSVDEIEGRTGYNLLDQVPDKLEEVIEAGVDQTLVQYGVYPTK